MDFSRLVDRFIEPFSPQTVRRRTAERLALAEMRKYDVATSGRRTNGWHRPSTSADREVRQGLVKARDSARELVRNNKYAAAAVRTMTAHAVGDGITTRAVHPDEGIAQKAQDAWDRWAESRIDGRNDHYAQQKLLFRSVVEGGEALALWGPGADGPDAVCRIVEGDFLDHMKNREATDQQGAIVQGVEFDRDGFRAAYWLHGSHPGGDWSRSRLAKRYAAEHIDHVYEELRPGQTRGVSWFAPVGMTLRDGGDAEDAMLMKLKVESCLALVLTPAENAAPSSPFDESGATGNGQGGGSGEGPKGPDRMRPGMVFRARPGETATSVNPSSTGGGVEFLRQQLMGVSANLAPYHLITGDPSQSNYTQVRAQLLGFYANLDDWQWNMLIPQHCGPAFYRRMRVLALETGDRRFLQVKGQQSVPVRRFIDPIKDAAGLSAELRLGIENYPRVMAARGLNWKKHLEETAEFYRESDALGLVLDGDPRRATQSGVLQAAAGYLGSGSRSVSED